MMAVVAVFTCGTALCGTTTYEFLRRYEFSQRVPFFLFSLFFPRSKTSGWE